MAVDAAAQLLHCWFISCGLSTAASAHWRWCSAVSEHSKPVSVGNLQGQRSTRDSRFYAPVWTSLSERKTFLNAPVHLCLLCHPENDSRHLLELPGGLSWSHLIPMSKVNISFVRVPIICGADIRVSLFDQVTFERKQKAARRNSAFPEWKSKRWTLKGSKCFCLTEESQRQEVHAFMLK